MERTKLWETIYNKSNKKITFYSTNEKLKEARARLVNNGIKNLAERVLDYDAYDRYYDEGAEAYFEGKTLSDVPITGNAWFREAWEEGWKNAKACDDEEYGTEYEDEYWEDYDLIQESVKLKEAFGDEMEMLEEIKTELEKIPEITNVEILTHKTNNDDYLKVEGPYDGCPGSNHPVTKLIQSIAEKYGKETEGWGWLYQTERVRDWEKENPAPVDPRYARGTSKLFTPSARNPKNKEAKELLMKYKKELEEWRNYKKENCPPSRDDGFTVSFAPAGHAASVEAFYNGTRYWGD